MNKDDIGSVDLTDPENLELKTATLEITHKNNLFDRKAKSDDEVVVQRNPESVKESLNVDEWLRIIDKLDEEGVEQVVLSGGEPTLRNQFHTILGYAINTIEDVVVQTNGATNVPLSDYDCKVAVEIEAMNPVYHNSIKRMTDPDRFSTDVENGALVDEKGGKCKYCGQNVRNANGARMHIKSSHPTQSVADFNYGMQEAGQPTVDDFEGMKDMIKQVDGFTWGNFLESRYPLHERESALRQALSKIKKISNPTVMRCTIYNNNDIERIVTEAEYRGVNTVFVPLKPVGRAKQNLLDQVPSPGRMKEVMGKVHELNNLLSTSHRVDSPLYTAARLKEIKRSLDPSRDLKEYYSVVDELETYWMRGRVSDIGVSTVNILHDGTVTPSPYIRGGDNALGNILSDEWADIYSSMANFNQGISGDEFCRPHQGFDPRQRSIACDLDIVLNNSYKNALVKNN